MIEKRIIHNEGRLDVVESRVVKSTEPETPNNVQLVEPPEPVKPEEGGGDDG